MRLVLFFVVLLQKINQYEQQLRKQTESEKRE